MPRRYLLLTAVSVAPILAYATGDPRYARVTLHYGFVTAVSVAPILAYIPAVPAGAAASGGSG